MTMTEPSGPLRCRFCDARLTHTVVDLGPSPLCQRIVRPAELSLPETFYPLCVYVCDRCFLVQLPGTVAREEIFDADYGYFSSYSETMLEHARSYVDLMCRRFGIGTRSRVVEIASNDGYLLQYFVQRGIPALGIDPTANTAAAAAGRGVPTHVAFFGRDTAGEVLDMGGPADLMLANNVLAHVPDLNDFISGVQVLLAPGGVVTMEFPLLLHLLHNNYWDTIYHEHYSYLSLGTVEAMFAHHGLTVFDVDEIPTHGGSVRVYGRHRSNAALEVSSRVAALKQRERDAGLADVLTYAAFGQRVAESKRNILDFLIDARRAGKTVVGYGAPGKGNTLLNYCGIRTDFLDFTVDRNPHKQGNFLPGSRIPIHDPAKIRETRPDYVFILPWNLRDEIREQLSYIREWGGRFVTPIPAVEIFD